MKKHILNNLGLSRIQALQEPNVNRRSGWKNCYSRADQFFIGGYTRIYAVSRANAAAAGKEDEGQADCQGCKSQSGGDTLELLSLFH
jgi:hypothetical protein